MKHKLNITKYFMLGIVFLTLVISCNNAKNGWEQASHENTIVAYEEFLNNYNDPSFVDQAIHNIWVLTTKESSIQKYEEFFAKYPSSSFSKLALDSIFGITAKENSITAYEDFLSKHPGTSSTLKATEGIKKLFVSLVPPTPTSHLNSSLSVDISFSRVASADSYVIYWSSLKNGVLRKENSHSTISVTTFEHWPNNFPLYYRIVAVRGNLMTKPSESSKAELLPSKNGTLCQICGDKAIGFCHNRKIYVCNTHNTYTSKEGTNWQCP